MPLVLDGSGGISGVDGTASNPAIEGTDSNTGIFYPAADTVAIGTGGTERLRVDSAGNAGLGVTPSVWQTSTVAFEVGSGTALWNPNSSNQTYLLTNASYSSSSFKYKSTATAAAYRMVGNSHEWLIAPSGTAGNAITFTQAMTLDASGNLLVGTTSQLGANLVSLNKSSGDMLAMRNPNATAGKYWSNIVGSDNKLYVVNNSSTGVSIADGATAWSSFSDERMKDVIEPIADAANKVSTLRTVIGKYKTDVEGTRRSFLFAQDVQSVLPEAVDASNPDELGLRYSEVIPLLVAAIKELKAEIDALKGTA